MESQLDELSYLVLRKLILSAHILVNMTIFLKKEPITVLDAMRPYKSDYKYNSYCGWPNFDEIKDKLIYDVDYKLGYPRTEIKCKKCGGHLAMFLMMDLKKQLVFVFMLTLLH